jgi:hypothetical protein
MSNIGIQQGATGKQVGQVPVASAGEYGEILVSELQARYYEWAYRGKVYTLNNGYAGTTLVAASAIGQTAWNPAVGLFNPLNSGVNLVILSATAGFLSGTPTSGGIVWGFVAPNAGVTAAGGAGAVSLATLVTGGSIAKTFAQSAMTGSAASVMLEPFPVTPFAGAIAATTSNNQVYQEIAGRFIVPPGGVIGISGTLGTSTVVQASLSWAEIAI